MLVICGFSYRSLRDSHLPNLQVNMNNSVIELYNGIIRNFCKHIMLDLKYENVVPSVIKNEIKMSLILSKTI